MNEQGPLLALTNRYLVSRLHLCTTGDALIAEIVRMSTSHSGEFALAVLDYPKLLQRAGVEADPVADVRDNDR